MSNTEETADWAASSVYDFTYLKFPQIEERIKAYESEPTAHSLNSLASFLLAFAFDPKDDWIIKYDHDEELGHTNFYTMKVDKNSPSDNNRTLHTLVKVILNPTDPFPGGWDRTIYDLENAPMIGNRCWAMLIRGLEIRLLEYHRDQKPRARAIPCDFIIESQSFETIHIRNNCTQVNNILARLPGEWPKPLNEVELTRLAGRLNIADTFSSGIDVCSTSPSKIDLDSSAKETSVRTHTSTPITNIEVTTKSSIIDSRPKVAPEVNPATSSDLTTHNRARARLESIVMKLEQEAAKYWKIAKGTLENADQSKTPLNETNVNIPPKVAPQSKIGDKEGKRAQYAKKATGTGSQSIKAKPTVWRNGTTQPKAWRKAESAAPKRVPRQSKEATSVKNLRQPNPTWNETPAPESNVVAQT